MAGRGLFFSASLVVSLALLPSGCRATPLAQQRGEDFEQLWAHLRDRYAYFDEKATGWARVRERYLPLAQAAATEGAFIQVLEQVLDELYDPHTHLNVNLASSWHIDPQALYAEWRDAKAILTEVKHDSPAFRAGLRPGMEVLGVDGKPVAEAVAARRPRCLGRPDPQAENWALLSALSGRHDQTSQELEVRMGEQPARRVLVEAFEAPDEPAVSFRRLPDDLGYIRIASFGDAAPSLSSDPAVVTAFDRALEGLKDTHGLVLDVRDNTGGDTTVSLPILGRLLSSKRQYAWMARRLGAGRRERWPEFVKPRGPWTYTGPVVALTNHWSMSVAEGFAMGLETTGRGLAVGTRMRGLGAGTERVVLRHSQIQVSYSAEPVYQLNGKSRSDFQPAVPVDLIGQDPTVADPILEAGIQALKRRFGGTSGPPSR